MKANHNQNRVNISFLLALGAVIGYHLFTLHCPPITADEPYYASTALYGHIRFWREILPPNMWILEKAYAYGNCFLHIGITKFTLTQLGLGPWQLRLPSVIFGLCSLLLVARFYRKLNVPYYRLLVLYFGLSQVFFFGSHSARPDALMLLIFLINAYWLCFKHPTGRLVAFVVGFVAALGFSVHWPTLLLFAVVPAYILIMETKMFYKTPCNYWWIVGAAVGVIYVFPNMNIDEFIPGLVVYFNNTPHAIPFLKWKFDIVSILKNVLLVTFPYGEWSYKWFVFVQIIFLSALSWELLRFRDRTVEERKCLLLAVGFFGAMAFISSSDSRIYYYYLIPWFLPVAAFLFKNLGNGVTKLGSRDATLLAMVAMLCYASEVNDLPPIWLIPLAIRLIFFGAQAGIVWIFSAIIWAALLAIDDPQIFITFFFGLKNFQYTPFLVLVCVLAPWVLLRSYKDELRVLLLGMGMNTVFRILMIAALFLNVMDEWKVVYSNIAAAKFTGPVSKIMERVHGKKILGPDMLWMYWPDENIQSINPLFYLKERYGDSKIAPLISRYRPDVVFWPEDRMREWPEIPGYIKGETFDLPYGEMREITLKQRK